MNAAARGRNPIPAMISAAAPEDAMNFRQSLRDAVRKSPLYPYVQGALESVRNEREARAWLRAGAHTSAAAPHLVKQAVIREHARRYGLRTLVETGTYLGTMVHAMRDEFDRIVSVEVDDALMRLARHRFDGDVRVNILHGDSGVVLRELVPTLSGPTLFWLDGHYSAGETSFGASHCPILEELPPILEAAERGHVILVDDARYFGVDPAYPSVPALRDFVAARRPDLSFSQENDILRWVPTA